MKQGTIERAVNSLGKGFDLTSDFRLKYCKGDEKLVALNETEKRDLTIPCFGSLADVSVDIKCDKGERTRFHSDILPFSQMSEYFNRRSSVAGKVPSGYFNAMFGLQSGAWATDAANIKYLGLDGYFIPLCNLRIDRFPLVLNEAVRNSVPSSWDPPQLARFIETYGTHVIVGMSIGGQDVVMVKQDMSSNLDPSLLKQHLDLLSNQLFTEACSLSLHKPRDSRNKLPEAFNVFDDTQTVAFNSYTINSKNGITVIRSKRGGDLTAESHSEWLITVPTMPDAINFSFIPITSLLKDVPGTGFLSHAINLYLRYKPPLGDLQYFLGFSTHKMWAPIHNDLPLGTAPNMAASSPPLQFNLMGPKLYVNTIPVTTDKRPVTGIRLYLEGMKCNRLAIHLQHLSTPTKTLQDRIGGTEFWRGSNEIPDSERYLEPINAKKFSHVCTAPVKYDPNWSEAGKLDGAFIVTGAQLQATKQGSKSVLHLRLLFSRVSHYCVVQKDWVIGSSGIGQKSGLFSALSTSITGNLNPDNKEKNKGIVLDSGVFPTGPPEQTHKMLKLVDTSQLCRGPQDGPGHWLVTGARLCSEKTKICLHVKFSLLNGLQ